MAARNVGKIFRLYSSVSRVNLRNYNLRANNINQFKPVSAFGLRLFSQEAAAETRNNDEGVHTIIKDTEKATGESQKHEFMAETRMLLDIVAKSLYSDKEVFVRELISNASDALEKQRYTALTNGRPSETPLEIHIGTDKQNRVLTIQDTGIGMTKEELISNLGTIARSGSKAFMDQLKSKNDTSQPPPDLSSIIGQFGVGFYSSFMVAEKVEVFTKSNAEGSQGWKWTSDGSGEYEIQEADNVTPGTKIRIFLKTDCREFCDEDSLKKVINKYSNFVGCPIFLNGKQVNTVQALWLTDPKQVKPEQHDEFYRFVANAYDRPRFTLHYKTDSPLMIRALLYFPEAKPGLFEMSRDADSGVALYTRKVLITNKADNLVPKWLRFLKGVVDSEDIPLNLSRELLQNSALIAKLRYVLTGRVLKFLNEQAIKKPDEYEKFHRDYGIFLKEAIVTSHDVNEKEEVAKLLRFESSTQPSGTKTGILDYISRMQEGQRDIYYLSAPSRALAESSPYQEGMKKKDVEVLFCYEPYDELVLLQLRQFQKFQLTSVEKVLRDDKSPDESSGDIIQGELDGLKDWLKTTLAGKIQNVKTTSRLESHPCVVTVEEMAAARQFIRTQSHNMPEESRFALLQPQLEINPKHPIIQKLTKLRNSDEKLATLVAKQILNNAMVSAGLVEDPRTALTDMNELLTLALQKH